MEWVNELLYRHILLTTFRIREKKMSQSYNAYDKYLEWQFHITEGFYSHLFEAISRADEENLAKFALGFPQEVEAYKTFTRTGAESFAGKCTPTHPLLLRLKGEL